MYMDKQDSNAMYQTSKLVLLSYFIQNVIESNVNCQMLVHRFDS